MSEPKSGEKNFRLNEVIELKGYLFKVTIIDSFTGSLGLKQISPVEAKHLRSIEKEQQPKS